MSATITIPINITPELQIGTVYDKNSGKETPVRLRDLMAMKDYNRTYTFTIKKEHPSVTHVGISIHEVQRHGDGWTEIANTIGGEEIQTMMLDYFNEHIWKHFLAGGMKQHEKMKSREQVPKYLHIHLHISTLNTKRGVKHTTKEKTAKKEQLKPMKQPTPKKMKTPKKTKKPKPKTQKLTQIEKFQQREEAILQEEREKQEVMAKGCCGFNSMGHALQGRSYKMR